MPLKHRSVNASICVSRVRAMPNARSQGAGLGVAGTAQLPEFRAPSGWDEAAFPLFLTLKEA